MKKSKIVKSTPRGQITLPKQWRSRVKADHFLVEMHEQKLIILPVHLGDLAGGEAVLFDADRDNGGKGVSPDEIIRALKNIRHG